MSRVPLRLREELKKYLAQKKEALCEDCRRRADTNPLRVFDCRQTVAGRWLRALPLSWSSFAGTASGISRVSRSISACSAFLSP